MPRELSAPEHALLEDVVRHLEGSHMLLSSTGLRRGQLVCTGAIVGRKAAVHRVGFCVQIRKQAGAFGSDMVLLRHLDGALTPHENQFFYTLTEAQHAQVAPLFEKLLEEEDFGGDHAYSLGGAHPRVGFIIEAEFDQEREPVLSPLVLKMTQVDKNGKPSTTITTFVG